MNPAPPQSLQQSYPRLPPGMPLRRLDILLGTLVAGAAVTLAFLASRVRDWFVMTDELQYAKLALSIADGTLLPTLRGERVSAYAPLYPLLLAPLYALLDAPSAFHAAHLLNGALYGSAAIPVYLLARAAHVRRGWSAIVAALALLGPWNVFAGFVLTESTAYPAFIWAVLACQRALDDPSVRRDALALAAVAVAVVDGRHAVRRHRVLAAAYAAGVVVAAIVGATGGVARLLGRYEVTATKGSLLPLEAVVHAGAHLDLIGLGIGLVPLLLGGAWLVSRRTAFSVL